jgi:hypothetical protein
MQLTQLQFRWKTDRLSMPAVAGASEERKLISMQKRIEEEKAVVSLMQNRDEIAAA